MEKKQSAHLVPASKVGIIRAGMRFLRDPHARTLDKLILVLWPLYLASPVDVLPELVLGPLGLADDTAVALRALYLVFYAARRYRRRKSPTRSSSE